MNKKFTVFVILATVLQVGAVGAVSIDNVNKDKRAWNLAADGKVYGFTVPEEVW